MKRSFRSAVFVGDALCVLTENGTLFHTGSLPLKGLHDAVVSAKLGEALEMMKKEMQLDRVDLQDCNHIHPFGSHLIVCSDSSVDVWKWHDQQGARVGHVGRGASKAVGVPNTSSLVCIDGHGDLMRWNWTEEILMGVWHLSVVDVMATSRVIVAVDQHQVIHVIDLATSEQISQVAGCARLVSSGLYLKWAEEEEGCVELVKEGETVSVVELMREEKVLRKKVVELLADIQDMNEVIRQLCSYSVASGESDPSRPLSVLADVLIDSIDVTVDDLRLVLKALSASGGVKSAVCTALGIRSNSERHALELIDLASTLSTSAELKSLVINTKHRFQSYIRVCPFDTDQWQAFRHCAAIVPDAVNWRMRADDFAGVELLWKRHVNRKTVGSEIDQVLEYALDPPYIDWIASDVIPCLNTSGLASLTAWILSNSATLTQWTCHGLVQATCDALEPCHHTQLDALSQSLADMIDLKKHGLAISEQKTPEEMATMLVHRLCPQEDWFANVKQYCTKRSLAMDDILLSVIIAEMNQDQDQALIEELLTKISNIDIKSQMLVDVIGGLAKPCDSMLALLKSSLNWPTALIDELSKAHQFAQ